MNCPACGAALRLSPTGQGAMCPGCDRLFAARDGAVGQEILAPVGVDPLVHAKTLGFPGPAAAAPPPAFAAMPAYDPRPVSMGWMRVASGLLGCVVTAGIIAVVALSIGASILWSFVGHHHR